MRAQWMSGADSKIVIVLVQTPTTARLARVVHLLMSCKDRQTWVNIRRVIQLCIYIGQLRSYSQRNRAPSS